MLANFAYKYIVEGNRDYGVEESVTDFVQDVGYLGSWDVNF
jgi:hypothetical protein